MEVCLSRFLTTRRQFSDVGRISLFGISTRNWRRALRQKNPSSRLTLQHRTLHSVSIRTIGIAIAIFMLTTTPVFADAITFFGEDLGPLTGADPRPQSQFARASFLSQLETHGTEDFEGFAPGTHSALSLDFGGIFGGDLAPAQDPINIAGGTSLATSGSQLLHFVQIINDSFVITLNPVDRLNSIGFYGIDVGDLEGQLTITLQNGVTQVIQVEVPHSQPSPTQTYFYFGVTFHDKIITSAQYNPTGTGAVAGFDAFLFDDITVGIARPVPEGGPNGPLLGVGLLMMGLAGWLRRSKPLQSSNH